MELLKSEPLINYYDVLEVHPQANAQQIYQAYTKIKKAYSLRNPEMFKNFTFEEIQELSILIEEAHSTLGNKETRDLYDAKLFHAHPELKDRPAETANEASPEAPASAPAPAVEDKSPTEPPAGYAKTSLSAYQIDESFEALIASQEYTDGVFLGKIRKYKKVKLEDFSQYTCINLKYLYAIEDNNYNALPAAVFTRGYIAQYCKILGLETDKVVTSFMKLYQNGRE